MKSFHVAEPSLFTYLSFALYFVIAKFSVAAIPGGGIIVMLPILENIFGFTPEMSSLITALYILFDPIITSANIAGNGAFAMVLNKISNLQFFKKSYIIKKS
jgi:Na+/H+-dicarboxylate symporter